MAVDRSWLTSKSVNELLEFREEMRHDFPIIALECTFELNQRGYFDVPRCTCQDNAGDDPDCPLHGDVA